MKTPTFDSPVLVCHVAVDGTEHWEMRRSVAEAKAILHAQVAWGEQAYIYELPKKWSYVWAPVAGGAREQT